MGTSVACAYATIYQGAYEELVIFPQMCQLGIRLYERLIDDVLAIIRDVDDNYKNLMIVMNNFGPTNKRLEWTSPGPKKMVNFLT